MNYLPKNKSKGNRYRLALFLVWVFVFGAIVFYFLGGVIMRAASPLWMGENKITKSLRAGKEFFRSKQSLISENTTLKERLASLELELSSRPPALNEDNALLSLIGRKAKKGTGLVASVLVRPPQTPYDIIVIDAGTDDGVVPDSEVALSEGPVLGMVLEVFKSSAKVKLFSSAGENTSAVLERFNLAVTLEGAGGGNFRIVVPRETPVEVGDRILSADVFSRLLAVVGEVEVKPTDSFKQILARSPANIFSIRFVEISK